MTRPFDISDAYLQVDQPTPTKIRIIDRPGANYTIHGAYLDSVMALVVGVITFQVLCKQTWVVRFV